MSGEKILLVGDSVTGPTGFANNLAGVAWSLAKEYDVHILGLQSFATNKVKIDIMGETRDTIEHPNLPKGKQKWDFGTKSLPVLLNQLKPDVLFTVNDIQMIQHVPTTLYKTSVNIKMMDLPSRKMISKDAIIMEIERNLQVFKEKYPLDMKWICLGPQDGDPPMYQWKNIYALADQVVAMCKYGQGVYKRFFNMDVPYIYHGVDTNIFKDTEKTNFKDKFVIGNFNRNQPRKQPVRCIEAFSKFAKDKDDVLLHMQMDWNDQFGWPIQYFSQMYGVMNKMVQPMPVGMPRTKVAEVYNMWDVNLNATGGEGFGLTTIEGSACGVPNIITDYTSSKELVTEGSPTPRGLLVPFKELYWEKMDVAAVQRSAIDIDKLSDAFNKYYYNRELLAKHGENGAKWIEKNCAYNVLEPKWLRLVKDVLSR